MPKVVYSQKYRKAWEQIPECANWLAAVPGDDTRARCKYCNKELACKLADLKGHAKTTSHTKSASPFVDSRQPKLVLDNRALLKKNKQRTSEIKLATFVAMHTAIHNVGHLNDLCNDVYADSASAGSKLKRTKCSAIIKKVLGRHFEQSLKVDINNGPFSVLIDESTDISVTKLLGIAIRYFSKNECKIVVTNLGLVEIAGGTADDIIDGIKRIFDVYQLNFSQLKGIGTDNASVMVGVNNGIFQKLKRDYNLPDLILIRCVCHSLQLAISESTKAHMPTNIEFLIQSTYTWFSYSSQRQTSYEKIYQLINNCSPLKISKTSNTRWMSIAKSVRRILDQWEELTLHFNLARNSERCYIAEELYKVYKDPAVKCYLVFLMPILQEVQKVNALFESEIADPTKLLDSLMNLLKFVGTKILNPLQVPRFNWMSGRVGDFLDPKPYLGYALQKEIETSHLNDQQEADLRNKCTSFLVHLFNQLQCRFPDNLVFLQKVNLISVHNVLKHQKECIIPLVEIFEKDPIKIDSILNGFRNIHLQKWTNVNDTLEFWYEVYKYRDASGDINPYQELVDCVIKILVLPHASADVERVFSAMNVFKTKLRNQMSLEMLNAILNIKFGLRRFGICCHDIKYPEDLLQHIDSAEKYVSEKYALSLTPLPDDFEEQVSIE